MWARCYEYCRFMIGGLACVFMILSVCGCSSRIDREAIANKVRRTEPRLQKFLEVFPDADVFLNHVWARGYGKPNPRDQLLQVRSSRKEGHRVWMSRNMHVEYCGSSYEWLGQEWRYCLKQPNARETIVLSETEFDAFLAARGDPASLKAFGIMPPMDVEKVVGGVRKLYPPARRLHEVFHDACWADVNKKARKREGIFYSVANLAEDVQLSVAHEIRVAADGMGVDLVSEPGNDISGEMILYITSARPGERLIKLSPDEFDKILAAKGDLAVVGQIWLEWARHKQKFQIVEKGYPDYTAFAGEGWEY